MDGFITALTGTNGITAATFFGPLTSMVPFLLVIIPVALGLRFARRSINTAGNKGKVKI